MLGTNAARTDSGRLDIWMGRNLTTQGYCLAEKERRRLSVGLRFTTGLCLLLVVTALALESWPMIFVLSAIGIAAGFTPRHPFDLLWNHAARHLVGAPALPPNPAPRRTAFRIATAWLLLVGVLLAAGMTIAGVALGGLLVAACATVTATNFCIPSELLALRARRTGARAMSSTAASE